jgi:RimJ/RimL family protein N-acetyltransferase
VLLVTERLTIRSFTLADVEQFAPIVADPEVMRYLNGGQTLSFDEARAYIANYLVLEQREGYSRNAVVHTGSGKLIGMCGLAKLPDYVDLGYRFARSLWGNGYATEAARAVVKHGFESLGLREIGVVIEQANAGSIRVAERLGYACRSESIDHDGAPAIRITLYPRTLIGASYCRLAGNSANFPGLPSAFAVSASLISSTFNMLAFQMLM